MSLEKIKSSLRELHGQLEKAGPVDEETGKLLSQLDTDLHRLLGEHAAGDADPDGLQERLESIAAGFDSRHPQLSAVLRELGVALARVGI